MPERAVLPEFSGIPNEQDDGRRTSSRKSVQTQKYLQYLEDQQVSVVAYEAIAYLEADPTGAYHPLQFFQASTDPDTIYYTIYWHQAMAASDKKQFLEATFESVLLSLYCLFTELCF